MSRNSHSLRLTQADIDARIKRMGGPEAFATHIRAHVALDAQLVKSRRQRPIGQPKPRKLTTPKVSERDVLRAVLKFLAIHPAVAWSARMNVGAVTEGGRHVRFGFKGCSDVIGQLTYRFFGKFLAVECKGSGRTKPERLADQLAFLSNVKRNGGIAIVARSVNDVAVVLDNLLRKK